ncbi:NAD(P)-dependent oxidoreductase [Sphingomonas sp. MMS24-J13]|uniref:NAD(P)-dependent oxidoreductase n=1 Tax=Sphingomonas sp. MMS24-J13 TaxID=3238686 RepID=UPI00384DDDAF
MGYPMAGHLTRAGHAVTVYNRTPARAAAWAAEYGGVTADTPARAAEDADIVFVCVGGDDDVRAVVTGPDGVFETMAPGTLLVDHTTASADLAREIAGLAAGQGLRFLDAPVSGGQAGAQNGVLTIMVGGDRAAFDRAQPIMAAYGRSISLMGPAGAGQLTKMANQICIAGIVQSLSEALDFAIRAGIDAKQAAEVMSGGAAGSWQMANRAATMVDGRFDFGFAVEWMRKDLGFCLAEGARLGATLPVTGIIDGYYAQVEARGGRRWDTSSLIDLLQRP